MEPRIQYAQTADGVNIAFWTLGEGMPLVIMPALPWSHVGQEWRIPEVRRWYERLAERRQIVRYDSRGAGLSDRDVPDFALGALVQDLEAVLERIGWEKVALFGSFHEGMAAIAYAARCPERVSRLVLWHSWARTLEIRSSVLRGIRRLLDTDWGLYAETLAHAFAGWSEGEQARRVAAVYREAITQQTMQAFIASMRAVDVTEILQQVTSPTLVLHRREAPFPQLGSARGLASRIPNARLVLLEGASGAQYLGDTEAVLTAIDEFLGEVEEAKPQAPPTGVVHTILFTDIEGSTALTQHLGDAKAQEVLRAHNSIVREALKACGGAEIKHTGDGFMASFSSVTSALECAIAMQRACAEHNESAEEPVAEDEDLFGTAVQLAARICARAEPGQILVPTVVRELAAGKGFLLADLGEIALRGFEDPVRLYEVRWREG